jgi:predicted amidohydrolase
MRVVSIQMEIGDRTKAENLARAEGLIRRAVGADLVLLPEIWNVGYFSFDKYAAEAEPLEGETVARLRAAARAANAYLFGGSFVERGPRGLHNTSVLIDPTGDVLGVYRKMHLFGYTSDEAKLLTPGDEVVVAKAPFGTVGLSTCYDLRFPELYRRQALAGAQLFLVASGWPYPRLEAWQILNRTRAIENQAFLASSNCVGVNRGRQFCGHSMIVDPWGTVLAGGGDDECLVAAEVDLAAVEEARTRFPAFTDRRLPI